MEKRGKKRRKENKRRRRRRKKSSIALLMEPWESARRERILGNMQHLTQHWTSWMQHQISMPSEPCILRWLTRCGRQHSSLPLISPPSLPHPHSLTHFLFLWFSLYISFFFFVTFLWERTKKRKDIRKRRKCTIIYICILPLLLFINHHCSAFLLTSAAHLTWMDGKELLVVTFFPSVLVSAYHLVFIHLFYFYLFFIIWYLISSMHTHAPEQFVK